jgi:hypothetical protein
LDGSRKDYGRDFDWPRRQAGDNRQEIIAKSNHVVLEFMNSQRLFT